MVLMLCSVDLPTPTLVFRLLPDLLCVFSSSLVFNLSFHDTNRDIYKINHIITQFTLFLYRGAAKNKAYLKLIGVTHVLNCAEGVHFCQINTGGYFYSQDNIKYLGINVLDVPQAKISIHFQETADFIERALMSGGKVLVHCMVGLSRSATIVLAYLMIKRGMRLEEAIRAVRRHREIRPNDGFLRQLMELEYMMSTSSNYGVPSINTSSSSSTSTASPAAAALMYPEFGTSLFYSQTSLR